MHLRPSKTALLTLTATILATPLLLRASDWPQFRGPDGSGISTEDKAPPLTWSDTENLAWKTPLPGPGNSSPIVAGNRVFITCYSGYGVDRSDPGDITELKRHLLCIDSKSGEKIWEKTVDAEMPEDEYRGFITEHGYASSTPVTDGERVYVFFGKTGVLAFDFKTGKRLWQTNVGKESGNRRWGSAASPILYKDMVIVNSAEESQSIRALNKETGEEVWSAEAASMELVYNTPAVVSLKGGRDDLVLAVPNEVWGLNPENGKLRWFAEMTPDGNISPSVVVGEDAVVYVTGGYRNKGSIAVRAGGKGDVTQSHVVWTSNESSYVPTPVLHEGHLYWVNERGRGHCLDAESGELVYQESITGNLASGAKSRGVYASATLVDGKLIVPSRISGTFIIDASPEFNQIAQNRFTSDDSEFNGTPAITDGRLYLRSNKFLYCIE